MANDRFVYFHRDKPTKDNVQHVLEDFVSDAGTVRWSEEQGRFYVDLPGKHRWALRRIFPESVRARAEQEQENEGRWLEVFLHVEGGAIVSIDVTTRFQDQFVNAIAEGIAAAFIHAFPSASTGESEETLKVVLESFVDERDRKIAVVNVVREITGIGLHEAKELVETAPVLVKDGVTKAVAEAMKKKLEDAGATASLRGSES